MADEKTPNHIQYIINAMVENQKGVDELVRDLDRISKAGRGAQKVMADLQKQVNQGLGVKSAQEARAFGAALAAFGAGDLPTRYANQQGRRTRAEIDASPEMQVAKNAKAFERQHKERMKFLERELDIYEQMAQVAQRLQAPGRFAGRADLQRRLEDYLDPLLVSDSGRTLSGAARTSKTKALMNQMSAGQLDPAPLVASGVSWMGLNRAELRETLQAVRDMRVETTRQRQEEERITRELQEQRRLEQALRVQNSQDKSIRRNFMKQHSDRMRAMPAEYVNDYFQQQVNPLRAQLSRHGFEALQHEVAELRKREADRESRASRNYDESWNRMRIAAENENRAFDKRKQRERDAPEQQALMANRRAGAFNGAGLFAIQGQLLANYATWGAGLGSMAFLGNYTVQYEKSLKQLQAIATATDGEMRDLDKTIVDVAKNSIFSAQEIADAATLMAQAGLSVKQINEALPAVKNLAIATGTDLATSMDAVTSTMTVFDLQTSDMARVANTLTAAMNMSKLTIDKFALGLQYSGNIAETVGIRYNELAALLGGMTDAGIRSGSTLGTGLRQLMLDLQSPSESAKSVFSRVGLSADQLDIESQGIFRVLRNLKDAGLTTADATEAFEVRAVAAFKALMNQLPDIEQLNESIMLTEAATTAAGVQMDSLAAKWTQFTTGAGAAFYKTTELTREALKGVLDVFIALFGAIEPLSGVLSIATLAGVTFMAVWSVAKVIGIIKGLGDMKRKMNEVTVATTGATGAARLLQGTIAVMGGPLTILTGAITAAVTVFGMLNGQTQDFSGQLDAARESTSRARGELDETTQAIEALDTSMKRVTSRYHVLAEEGSPELRSEITELNISFAKHGLVLDQNNDKIDTVIAKMAELRQAMSATAILQARIAATSARSELNLLASNGVQQLVTGDWESGRAPSVDLQRLAQMTGRDQGLADFWRLLVQGRTASGGDVRSIGGLQSLDINEVLNMRGSLAQVQTRLLSEKNGANRKRSAAEIDADLAEIDKANAWAAQLFLIASRIRNKNIEVGNLDKSEAAARAFSEEFDFGAFQTFVQRSKGMIGEDLLEISSQTGVGADKTQEQLKNLQGIWNDNIEGVVEERDALFQRWIDAGIVKTLDEAKTLLSTAPVGDDVNWVVNSLTREISKLDPEVRKLFDASFREMSDAYAAETRRILEGSRVATMKLPAGSVPSAALFGDRITGTPDAPIWNRPSLPEAAKDMEAAFQKQRAAAEQAFRYKYPGAFEIDSRDGKTKDPSRTAEWLGQARELDEGFTRQMETLYRYYQKDFVTPEEKSKREKDAEIELLKTRIAEVRARLQEIRGSVDGQSPADAVWNAVSQYEAAFAILRELELELEARTWDASPWKDTSRAAELRQANLDALARQLAANEGKTLGDLTNTAYDTEGRDRSRLAKQSRQAAESRLEAELAATSALSSVEAARAKISVASTLVDSIVEEFTKEFWSRPEYREKGQTLEAIDQFTTELMDVIVRRTQNVLAVAAAMVEERGYRASQRIREIEAQQASFDNIWNRAGVSDTQRWMVDRDMQIAQMEAAGARIPALADQRAMLEAEATRLKFGVGLSKPGSAQHTALSRELLTVQREMVGVMRELEQATLDYAAALDTATDPAWGDLFRASIQMWAEGEGVMMSFAETVSDTLPSIFSNAGSAINQTLGDIASHARDTGDAVEDMARGILRSLLDMALKILANHMIQAAFQLFPGFSPQAAGGSKGGFDVATLAYPGQDVYSTGRGFSGGGEVKGIIQNRDSVHAKLMPGEVVMRKTAVDMIGKDNLLRMNQTGEMATRMSAMVIDQKRDPDMVNVYVVPQNTQPSIGPRDVIVALTDDIMKDGQSKKLIKAVAMGALG